MLKADLAKKPEDWDILHLVDVECTYPEARSSECTAPPSYKCPYRHYKDPSPPARASIKSGVEGGLLQSRPLRLTLSRS